VKTVRALLYKDILGSVAFVAAAFLALFFFFDFVDGLESLGRSGRSLLTAVLAALLEVPGHLYDLSPIAVLIGTIYALSRLAQSSEFTILRTSGLGPGHALGLLATIGLLFAVLTFAVGEFLAPPAETRLAKLKAEAAGALRVGGAGAWLKEKRQTPEGEVSVSLNVGGVRASGDLTDVLILEFDADGRQLTRIGAKSATVDSSGLWTLRQAVVTRWPRAQGGDDAVRESSHDSLPWQSSLAADVVASAVLPLSTMSTLDLYRYSAHLAGQEQAAQRHQIRFWEKALYPLACLVMVALALPFAYLHARAGGVGLRVFGGIMLGICFVILNKLSGHIGLLRDWTPWVAAATPGLVYLLLSMAAFAWLVRYR
jgi:lipopolysaccharide export system permease protein